MPIDQRTLTTGEVAGSGIFDELMRTVKSHVHAELKDGRINGEGYAQVYLGSLQTAMQGALQYSLGYELVNKQLLLLDEQIEQGEKQNELLDLQKEMLRVQIDTALYNLEFMMPKQLEMLTHQVDNAEQQVLMTKEQIKQVTAQIALTGKQEDLLDEQILAAEGQHTDMTTGLIGKQQAKSQAEIDMLNQKKLTETAQTEGGFVGDEAGGTIGGLVGIEMALKDVQKESFLRDAEQKAAKMYTDVFATLFATDPNDAYSMPENYGYDITTARNVMDKLLAGVDVERSKVDTIGVGVSVPEVDEGTGAAPITYPRTFDTTET